MKKLYFISTLALITFFSGKAFSQVSSQTFTSSGSFTVPAGTTSITIEVVGAGGSGGGNGTGGGGGGGYASGSYTVTPLSTLTVTVGIGGSGASSGTTSVSGLISASGGANGVSVPNPTVGGGGTGGTGTGGTIVNYTGGTGGGGYYTYFGGGGGGAAGLSGNGANGGNTIAWTSVCMTPGGAAGTGGGAPGGDGGKGAGFTDAACNITDPAAPGVNYGGGGGGGNGNGGGPGTGADGYCKITWGTTGITDLSKNVVTVSQNPFSDKINVKNTTGNEVYELIDVKGQVVWSGKNIELKDFSDLADELYILKVHTQNSVQIVKLLKESK